MTPGFFSSSHWINWKEASKTLSKKGVKYNLLREESFVAETISNYINIKQRQLL